MKNKIFKTCIILVMILTMTMTNFIFVGSSLISYATDNLATNHKNVEFEAYFKEEEEALILRINVRKEGYFNGEIELENSNFTLKESESAYVSKIEDNKIYLNQMNAGIVEEIKVKVEPMKEENFSIGLLNMVSRIKLKGIYRDSTERDIKIQANRDIAFKISENNTQENVKNEIEVITNKTMEINGEPKRVLQISYHMGLHENNYPMQEITAKIDIAELEEKYEIEKIEQLNNMTTSQYQDKENAVEITLRNEANAEGKANWKKQGNENLILTYIFDKEAKIENKEIKAYETVRLYSGKELKAESKTTIGQKEVDGTVEVHSKNAEEVIYKGKLNAGMERNYQTTTQVKINLAKAVKELKLEENNSQEGVAITYRGTSIKKEQFDKILGQNGTITIYDQNGEIVETVTSSNAMNEEGNIVLDYADKEITNLKLETTKPVAEGILELNHTKSVRSNGEAEQIKSNIIANGNEIETTIKLEDATTKATLEVDKESLSTVVGNNVEIKVVLASSSEQYNLYKNPEITIELPEEVEKVNINKIDLLYEDELAIKNYAVNGRTIQVALEGEQTQYKEESIEGATIVMDTTMEVNRKATTKDEEIQMIYKNNNEEGNTSKGIRIVAPTDITPIYSIPNLAIETIGQEEKTQVILAKAAEEKTVEAQIEAINNNQDSIENVKILGEFPTNHKESNLNAEILEGIHFENAKIYYTENAEATEDLEKAENGWTENIADSNKVSKYLIAIDKIESQNSVKGSYTYKIPANLEYNQTATTGYSIKYTNSNTKVENKLSATTIEMTTGIGPKVEAKLISQITGKESNAEVKNGEVIRYKIEVANIGTEDVQNIQVSAKVPEGTTMVVPEEKYEYTGASYYQELDNKNYEAMIQNLKVGEVTYAEYEVRVNNQVAEGTVLNNQAEIKYGDVTKQTEETKNTTKKGNLRVSVKRITDRSVELYETGVVQYFAMIENISDQKQENVKVQTHLPANLEVEELTLYTGMEREEAEFYTIGETEPIQEEGSTQTTETENDKLKAETLEYSEEVNIGTLEPGETKVLSYDMLIHKMENGNSQVDFSVTVKNKKEEYQSNSWKDKINPIEVGISMMDNTESQYVKEGDEIEYTIKIENKSNSETTGLILKDSIPSQLTINEITQDGEVIEGNEENDIYLPITIERNATTTVVIKAVVDYSEGREKAEAITNVAYAEVFGETIAATSEINHIIQGNSNNGGNTTPGGNNNNNGNSNNNGTGNVANGDKTITGIAWFDENANGQKEAGEKLLSNIKVRLLNTKTNHLVKEENGQVLEATTNENGVYVLDRIESGRYIAIFEYDNTQYALTKYKAEGIAEAENSNAVNSELVIEDEKEKVAATDILEIQDNNISNMNIGLIKLENFDLSLDKYVSKILIQNANGTTVREYNNETMAKVEMDAKTVNGSTVIIEYKIKVTNNGEVEGYAKKIVDYVATDLKFSSELNKDWYQVGDSLYTASLANEKIKPGETKTVTLTLTKAMTENNTGLVANTAEIAEDYNELGIADSNSTPGNRAKDENDFGLAEVVLSIRTGGIVYASIAIAIVVALGVVAIIIRKKKNKEEVQ